MKLLKRLLIIHWHNYTKEVIEFDKINFLTGKTAAGKSTIIDAMQLVLLGDTGGGFFNKAANSKSERTLKSYLFGEKGDDGDTGYRYMREGSRFSSYVAMEFYDTERIKYFVTGLICDCYKDQNFDHKWFIINNNGFPDNMFIDTREKAPYDIKGLKTFLNMWIKNKSAYEFCDSNVRYREVTKGIFGQIKDNYRTLLRKAVPFTPITDIEQFITESICDVKNEINIHNMQNDIRQYKNLEHDAVVIGERIEILKQISNKHNDYFYARERYDLANYILIRAEKQSKLNSERSYINQIENKTQAVETNKKQILSLAEGLEIARKKRNELNEELLTSDFAKKQKSLSEKILALNTRIKEIKDRLNELLYRIHRYGVSWSDNLRNMETANLIFDYSNWKDFFAEMKVLDIETADKTDFIEVSQKFKDIYTRVKDLERDINKQVLDLKNIIEELKHTIFSLEKGIKPYRFKIRKLKELIESGLKEKYNKAIDVSILADLIEIKDQRWRNAIEGYLDNQKFYLIVDENYFSESLIIYNNIKKSENINDVGLVDIGKLKQKHNKEILKNSLAEEIESENKNAILYMNFLLGEVIKCDHVDDLRNHKIAITDDGMLYKGFVARRINPEKYANPYIGRKSLQLLLDNKKYELEESMNSYAIIQNHHNIVANAAKQRILEEFEAESYIKHISEGRNLPELFNELDEIQTEYDNLDFTFAEKIKEQINRLDNEIKDKSNTVQSLRDKNTKAETQIENLKNELLPGVISEIENITKKIADQYKQEWIEQTGEVQFGHELKEKKNLDVLKADYEANRPVIYKIMEAYKKERTNKRSDYNRDYKMSYDVYEEDNKHYAKELENLDSIELPKYMDRIKDSKEKAYYQFRDDFIAKIKSNIETVDMQLKELNASLKQSVFGTDTYRFEKKPRPEYKRFYDMIMDPLLMDTDGWNMASQAFNEKYKEEISELFQQLILNESNITAEKRAEYEKIIKKFTDYKTYLVFDLIVINPEGEEQRLSKTLLKKSGGETQIPFYISMLASFSQACRIKNTKNNNTIRVIILDEAFSKMDGERIKESIKLLRRFDLQAVFSAPPDKIPDIAPLVDRNIAVFKDNKHSFTKIFDPKDLEELIEE